METLPGSVQPSDAFSAVVLCGGESSRMGRDKASLPFGPESLLHRMLRLIGGHADDVVLAAGSAQVVPEGLTVVRDPVPGLGPVPAMLAALARVRYDRVFVVACDTPLLQPALIPWLMELGAGRDACVPVVDGRHMATCAVYRASAVLAASPPSDVPRSLRTLLSRLNTRFVTMDELRRVDERLLSFVPCNTPDDYRRALALADLDE